MNNYLNEIDEIRRRVNVSYEDAKEAIEKCNGDVLEAIVYLERNNKIRYGVQEKRGFFNSLGNLIHKGNKYRLVMRKGEITGFNLTLNTVAVITIITFPLIGFTAVGALIALIAGYRFKIEGNMGEDLNINKTLDRFQDAVENAKNDTVNGFSCNGEKTKL